MIRITKKRGFIILFFIFLSYFISVFATAGTFYGDLRTGLIELENYKYPVFLYVPDAVKAGSKYPLVISIPDEGETAEENIKKWQSMTQVRTVIILVPTYLRPEDVPNSYDRWLFQIKNLVSFEFPVNRKAIYLVGEKGSASYVAYLGVNFPEEFSAVALLEGSPVGAFEKLMDLKTRPSRQVPFYIALKESQQNLFESTKTKVYEFEKYGYDMEVETLPDTEDLHRREFTKKLLERLSQKAEDWYALAQQDRKALKEKMRSSVKNFFTI